MESITGANGPLDWAGRPEIVTFPAYCMGQEPMAVELVVVVVGVAMGARCSEAKFLERAASYKSLAVNVGSLARKIAINKIDNLWA